MKRHILSIAIILTCGIQSLQAQEAIVNSGDTTQINLKKTKIIIIDLSKDSSNVDREDADEEESYFQHWSGVYFGINMLVNNQMSIARPAGAPFMELNHSKSHQWQINFIEKTFPILSNHIQFSTGLGFDFRGYAFQNDFSIIPGVDSVSAVPSAFKLEQNRLNITSFRVPIILGINTHKDPNEGLHLSVGIIGSSTMSSRLKQKYFDNGEKHVDKLRNPFNVNPWNLTAVAGFGLGSWIYIYGEYQLTPLFEQGLNPELMPFTIGVRLLDFN